MEQNNHPERIETVFKFMIPGGQTPERVDVYLTNSIQNATRNKVQKAIDMGLVTVNGKVIKSSRKIQPNDIIICKIYRLPPLQLIPQNIPIDIIYEDEHLLVVNKPAGMVSHPGFGNRYGTLVNAMLYHLGQREAIQIDIDDDDDEDVQDEGMIFANSDIRPGIVHRLDKDTSGLMLIAKNSTILAQLQKQFADRTVSREYYALLWGEMPEDNGTIEGDIGRSQRDRKLFAVVKRGGKPAITDYFTIEKFDYLTLCKMKLRTGRTHQIRVHCSNIKHPVFGDPSYGGDAILYGGHNLKFRHKAEKALKMIDRQMLHAKSITFYHPVVKDTMKFESQLPEDFQNILNLFANQ